MSSGGVGQRGVPVRFEGAGGAGRHRQSESSGQPERPERPLLPPALWALAASIALMRTVLGASPPSGALIVAACAATAVVVLACALLFRTRRRALIGSVAAVGLALACAGLACALELMRQASVEQTLLSSSVSSHAFTVEGDMREGASGWRGRARLDGGAGVVWLVADEPFGPGATVRCVGRYTPNEENDWGVSSRTQGISGTVRVVHVLETSPAEGVMGAIVRLRSSVLASLGAEKSDARALVAGSVCGHSAAMSERGLDDLFAACGISHLVAVSGGHLAMLTSIFAVLFARSSLRVSVRSALLLLVTGAFVAFCGAPVSAIRAWFMSLAAELSRLAGRRSHPLTSASAVALAMALAEPSACGQLGFLLSVICVCGICALGPYARYVVDVLLGSVRCAAPLRSVSEDAREALALTIVSQVLTAPLTCSAFGTLSLVAPLANVLLGPLFSALLFAGLLAAVLFWAPALQSLALAGCEVVGGAVMVVVRVLAALPGACVAVSMDEGTALLVLAAGLAVLLAAWPRISRQVLAAALTCLVAAALAWHVRWRLFAPACIRVLDVGQGDAILITDGPAAVLVDTGPDSSVVDALARNNVNHLDAVVLTHLHSDHAGGLDDVLAVIDVDRVVVPEETDVSQLALDLECTEIAYGDTLHAGGFSMRAISPVEPAGGEGNAGSLELLVTYDDGTRELTALLAADAERDETGAALERGDVGDIDFLKVGHHGSEASLTSEIACALDPEVSVASAGAGNSYGHPDPVCVSALEEAGSLFLCTMDAGDVCVEPGSAGPRVSCQRDGP